MFDEKMISAMKKRGRYIRQAVQGDKELGRLSLLPGTWANEQGFEGRGWNMIALPSETAPFKYRLLMNQYNEVLSFITADKGVPNRGLSEDGSGVDADQVIVALDYQQKIDQIAVDDFPPTDDETRGRVPKPIHHEPGLFLNMTNRTTNGFDIARLGTIPHGNAVLALGRSNVVDDIDLSGLRMSGLPIGLGVGIRVDEDPDPARPSYLDPYRHYHNHPFKGVVTDADFPGFEPVDPVNLLRLAAADLDIKRTTVLDLDTTTETAGIVNIPFIVDQADATEMRSMFWIHELHETGDADEPRLVLQYAQIVMLDFFGRRDGGPGRIKWPHVSINTMVKVSKEGEDMQTMLEKY